MEEVPGDFAIHYQPRSIEFPINLFNVYDNKIDKEILKPITSNKYDFTFMMIMTSPTTFTMEVHFNTSYLKKFPDVSPLDNEDYLPAVKTFICSLLINNPDWGSLMFQMKQENPACNFEIRFNFIDRKIGFDHIHKDNSLFSSLTYLKPTSVTPELSFGYNEIERIAYYAVSSEVSPTTGAIMAEFIDLEKAYRRENYCSIYRYNIRHMTLPTVSFSDWLLYHGTPNNRPEDSDTGVITRQFDYGDNALADLRMSFTPCLGRNCAVTESRENREILRMVIKPILTEEIRQYTKIPSIEDVNIMDFFDDFKKEIPSITITHENFIESLGDLQSKDGIYTPSRCRIAMNVGGKKKTTKKRSKRTKQCRKRKGATRSNRSIKHFKGL